MSILKYIFHHEIFQAFQPTYSDDYPLDNCYHFTTVRLSPSMLIKSRKKNEEVLEE